MGYTCRNYRAAGAMYSGYSQGVVLADLYREDGQMYRTAPVADCGSWSEAISYANVKNNELKAAEREQAEHGDRRESGVDKCSDNADQGEAGPVGGSGGG